MSALINSGLLKQAMSFDDYLALTKHIVDSKLTEGKYSNPATHRYTRSNLERMKLVLDRMVLEQKLYNLLSDLNEDWIWLVLSEPWCGDASWGTPALYLIASASERIDFKILLRDEHMDLMADFQTEGSDSIPKLICLRKSDLSVIGTWGPRPAVLQEQILAAMKQPGADYRESVRAMHAWYEQDMCRSIQLELIDLIKKWKNS